MDIDINPKPLKVGVMNQPTSIPREKDALKTLKPTNPPETVSQLKRIPEQKINELKESQLKNNAPPGRINTFA